MSVKDLTKDDYLTAIQAGAPNELASRIINKESKHRQPNSQEVIYRFVFDDGAIIEWEHRPVPIGQPIWGGWIEDRISLVKLPNNNVCGLEEGVLFERDIFNELGL
jgi:hypothetical protein